VYVIQVEFHLNRYSRTVDVLSALTRLQYGGDEADLAAALRLVYTEVFTAGNGARTGESDVARVAVVFTENRSVNLTATVAEAWAARGAGIGIVVVGIGSAIDPYELSAVASYPHEHNTFHVERLMNMTAIRNSLKRIICRGIYLFIYSFIHSPILTVLQLHATILSNTAVLFAAHTVALNPWYRATPELWTTFCLCYKRD